MKLSIPQSPLILAPLLVGCAFDGASADSKTQGALATDCSNLQSWKGNDWRLSFTAGEVIQHQGVRYQANRDVQYPNAECAPDNPTSWCSNWFTPLGACDGDPGPTATCDDGLQNQNETGVDCGGSCEACPVAETCDDGLQNQNETGVDCGGSCEACPVAETCDDGLQNQNETGVDCGGSCDACTLPETGTAVPAKIEAEDFDSYNDSTNSHSGNCGSGPVDQQTTSDDGGGCNIGWTTAGEWLQYELEVPEDGRFDITLRLAAKDSGKRVSLSVDGQNLGTVVSPGDGWQSWQSRTVTAAGLSSGSASLRVTFLDGATNLNWIELEETSDEPPELPGGDYRDVSLQSSVSGVQPMTGIVLWNGSGGDERPEIQLEYSYVGFDTVAKSLSPSGWDWSGVESLLNNIASHEHQAVLRFYYAYPGSTTRVPQYIKALGDYSETSGTTEGKETWFPDWSHSELKSFTKTFYTEFAKRYDADPRMAFLQVGFGLWGEYHIYQPGAALGVNFPDKTYQREFVEHLDGAFSSLHWSISIDAASSSLTPFASVNGLKDIAFGLFDDSFLHANHGDYNNDCFEFFGTAKRLTSPIGGEFSYYSTYDQQNVLSLPNGPHGISFEELAAQYNLSYIIGNDQPNYQSWSRIEQAGMATGYHFEVVSFEASNSASLVTMRNNGIAPIYYDAYPSVNGVRSSESLRGLLPGAQRDFTILSGGNSPAFGIESDRLVPGQTIEFDAAL